MERVGKDIKNFFTNHRRQCKLMNTYSGVGIGALVESERFGQVQVVDFVLRNRIYYRYRWDVDSTDVHRDKVKIKSVHRFVVNTPRHGRWRTVDGRPNVRRRRLSYEETKQIMLAHLIQRDQIAWLVRMYPEERENIEALRLQYAPGIVFHRPLWIPPRLNFNQE
jgi:hypothetical protein